MKECCFYHLPHVHPSNIGVRQIFVCTHPVWDSNKRGDFEPVVYCGSDINKCDMRKYNLTK